MAILDFILGRHLASDEDKDERVGPLAGLSVFGLDALSSAAYGPEAALTVLIPLGNRWSRFRPSDHCRGISHSNDRLF